jgi:hypothetical protein
MNKKDVVNSRFIEKNFYNIDTTDFLLDLDD